MRFPVNPKLKPEELEEEILIRKEKVIPPHYRNQLFGLVNLAYSAHRIPRIKPDDVWLNILSFLALNVNKNSDHYRQYLAGAEEKENIILYVEDDFQFERDFPGMIEKFIEEVAKKNNSNTFKQLICDFSTTTPIQLLHSQVAMAYMVEKYFSMELRLMCGFPAIEFAGNIDDWNKMIGKISSFASIAHPSIAPYLEKCISFVGNVVKVWKGDKELLKDFFGSMRCGSGSTEYFGWFLDIFPKFDRPSSIQTSRVKYDFVINDEDYTIDIGPVGVRKVDDVLEIVSDWFVEPTKPRGWKYDDKPIPGIIENEESYPHLTYGGKPLHELVIKSLPEGSKLEAVYLEKNSFFGSFSFKISCQDIEGSEYPARFARYDFVDGEARMSYSGIYGKNHLQGEEPVWEA